MSRLIHAYVSKYYDPVKAHEYYMKNRELKGRSTTEFNKGKQRSELISIKLVHQNRR